MRQVIPRTPCAADVSLRSHLALPAPKSRVCIARNHLPNLQATMNGMVNSIQPEQYPPNPALPRNEHPAYPRLSGTDDRKSILKVKS